MNWNWKEWLDYWPVAVFAGLCLTALVQLVYYLVIFRKLIVFKQTEAISSRTQPVSVIVCARNEAHNLEENLPDVLSQAYTTTHEVLVVNDNSTDETKYFLEELGKLFRHLKVVNLTQEAKLIPGKKYPLSIGIKSSKHEVVLLTDADCKPAGPNWIEQMQACYRDGIEIVLGYGAYHKTPGLLNKLIRFETFHAALQYLSYALKGMPYMGVGRNLSYKKSLFYQVKGFSSINHIPGGDDDLFLNKVATAGNTTVSLHHESFTYSAAPSNFAGWFRQKSRHYSTAKYYKPKHRFWLGLYAATYGMFYPLLVTTAIFYHWQYALGILLLRWLVLGIVWQKAMYRLNEKDLFPLFWLLDIWQFFYYFIFSFTLFKKPATNWEK